MEKLNYSLKIMIRNFFRRKFVVINILGLAIGLTVSLLILLYIRYETSFDNFNPNAENIYRLTRKSIQDGTVSASTPLALSDVLKKDNPEIDQVVGLMRTWQPIEVNHVKYENPQGAIVEKGFFKLFHFPLILGDPDNIFHDPYEAVVTSELAHKLYGSGNPIGKTLSFEDHLFTITGVIDPMPSNSIFHFDYLLSDQYRYVTYPDLSDRWYEMGLFTFVTFKRNRVPDGFVGKLKNIEKTYYPDFMKNRHNYLLDKFEGSHLNSSLQNDLVAAVPPIYLWILGVIALGILLIACLNFMNISIASSGKRNIETGIKKVNGASSGGLIRSFFAETSLVVFISLLIAFAGVTLLWPSFNHLIGKDITVDLFDPLMWIWTIGFCMITILLSGLYPSLILSKPSPLKILLQNGSPEHRSMSLQKGFVVLQFALTIVLAITLLFIFKQVSFMQNHDTGFSQKNLISMSVRSLGKNGNERLKNARLLAQDLEKYQAQNGYGKATITEFVPGFGFRNFFKVYDNGRNDSHGMEMLSCDVDENFNQVFGLKMLYGRYFSDDYSTDRNVIVINETAWKKLGWKTLEGKQIGLFTRDNKKTVVGVINDINIKSLQYPIQPMIYQFGRHHNYPGYLTIRVEDGELSESVAFIKGQWKKLFPNVPFEYESVREKYQSAYGEEEKLAKITSVFSILAMLLSLLGIFALSALQSEKRTKEIGIRKVNGAKISEVMTMLNRDFIKWVAIAFVVATPLAYYATTKWLENFAYKTNLSWWIFALAGLLALGIALLTVSWQSWRAATRNPVEALRYE